MRNNWLVLLLKWALNKEIEITHGQNHSDMINGVLRLESSGIYIISRGESAIFIGVQWLNYSLIVLHGLKFLISPQVDDAWRH